MPAWAAYICRKTFGMLTNRRAHCRLCGNAVCSTTEGCSGPVPLGGPEEMAKRTCSQPLCCLCRRTLSPAAACCVASRGGAVVQAAKASGEAQVVQDGSWTHVRGCRSCLSVLNRCVPCVPCGQRRGSRGARLIGTS